MTSTARVAAVLSVLAAAALFAGCTSAPGGTPTTSPVSSAAPSADADDFDDVEGSIVDDGRMFAVVTWGSSSCVPQVGDVSANGQTVTVELVDPDADAVCTADMAQRASLGSLPEGVDPTKEVTLDVTYGDIRDDVDIDGDAAFTGTPGSQTDYLPSAGWFDDEALVLVTWGSSTCLPIVETIEGSGSAGTVGFKTDDTQQCTMDMVPRATLIQFADDQVDDDSFTLTLVGGNLDGTVAVRG